MSKGYRIAGELVSDAVGEEFGRLMAERDNLRQQVDHINLLVEQTGRRVQCADCEALAAALRELWPTQA